MYKIIVEERSLAPRVTGQTENMEMAGKLNFSVRAFPGTNLTDIEKAITNAFAQFEKDGFSDSDLSRVKALNESAFLNSISSVKDKSFHLAFYNTFKGTPGYLTEHYTRYQNVTREDIMRVYEKYLKGQHYVATSFVPKGSVDLVVKGSTRFPVVEEDINEKVEKKELANILIDPIPSKIDRSKAPAAKDNPELTTPKVWVNALKNGVKVLGTEQRELPMISCTLEIKGGLFQESIERLGVGNLVASMLTEGTKNKTPSELEEAIDALGSRIRISNGEEYLTIRISCLRRNLNATFMLLEEMITQPRWDAASFERLKKETLDSIERQDSRASSLGNRVMGQLLYGKDNVLAYTPSGTLETVNRISLEDLSKFYATNITPQNAHITIVGDISNEEAMKAMASLDDHWKGKAVAIPAPTQVEKRTQTQLYFVDLPDAKQSYVAVCYLAMKSSNPDFMAASLMNERLGGGFNSRLNLVLREEKGYTYGASSGFLRSSFQAPFLAASSVRSNATQDSVRIFKEILTSYADDINEEDISSTKDGHIKSYALANESLDSLNRWLTRIAREDLPIDYREQDLKKILSFTLEESRAMAKKWLPEAMIYLVVGDAATQLAPLAEVGLGTPILLDKKGIPVK